MPDFLQRFHSGKCTDVGRLHLIEACANLLSVQSGCLKTRLFASMLSAKPVPAGWVYCMMATVGVSLLERQQRYKDAVARLEQLLGESRMRC